jgi:hypothetical protein
LNKEFTARRKFRAGSRSYNEPELSTKDVHKDVER